MKTEKAIFAGIIGLLVSSFAASAVATLAWVSTSRETLSSLSGVRLQAEKGTLVGHIHAFGAASNIDDEDPDYVYGQNETLKIDSVARDVSSKDGLRFLKPNWISTDGFVLESVDDVTGKPKHYSEFLVELSNPGNGALSVYLGKDTSIDPAMDNEGSRAFASWARVALNAYNASDPLHPSRAEVLSATHVMTFERKNPLGTAVKEHNDSYLASASIAGGLDIGHYEESDPHHFIEDLEEVNKDTPTSHPQYLFILEPGTTRYLYGTLWLEGTETFLQDQADGGSIDLSLSFRAVDA